LKQEGPASDITIRDPLLESVKGLDAAFGMAKPNKDLMSSIEMKTINELLKKNEGQINSLTQAVRIVSKH
jgi:hypothetical protein